MATPLIVLFAAQVLLGLVLLALLLRGERKAVLAAVHLLLGAAGLEGVLYTIQNGEREAGPAGIAAAGFIALALLIGLATPMLARRWRQAGTLLLAAHIGLGAAGVILLFAWASA